MVLTITSLLSVLVITLAFRTNYLHNLEVVVLILFISNLVNDIYSMAGLNLDYIATSNKLDEFYAFVVICSALIPAFITWMVGFTLSIRTFIWKNVFMLIIPFVLVTIEYTADSVGIIEHHQMVMWESLLVWYIVLPIVFFFRRLYSLLLKGV